MVPLTRADMDRVLEDHFAYEAADDVDGVLGTLAADVEHDVVGSPNGPTGRDGAREFYQGLFTDLSDGNFTTIRRLYGEDFVVDESCWRGTASGHPFGLDGRGRPLEFRLLHVMQFTDDGNISRENVWVDLAAVIAQLPQD